MKLNPFSKRKGHRSNLKPIHLIDFNDSSDSYAEAFRMMRLQMEAVLGNGFPETSRSILITSTLQGEGKTTTAVNLARASAVAGIRTILVDADNRHPMVNKVFHIDQKPGLTDLVIEGKVDSTFIKPSDIENLDLIPAGKKQELTAELFGSDRFLKLLNFLKTTYQLVIIDSTPFGMFADSGAIARNVDATFVVFHVGRTDPRNAEKTVKALKALSGNVKGVIMSRVSSKHRSGYYYGYHDYYAYYGKTDGKEK
ncbi:MAG TPA: CpsD/CapB family tyrosine-protein kinase [bacterium]|nr:CpsD/CapB family tyrosine-protein kinase [bacterium]